MRDGRETDIGVIISAAIVVGITLLLYLPALQCGFVNVDDPDYVLNNPVIRHFDGQTVLAIFTRPLVGWWMPLTWLSFMVDFRFWGLNPLGYHLTNVLLHAMNAGIVVLIAGKLLPGRQDPASGSGYLYPLMLLFAGLLFAVHPLRVESVVWVAERKDVLNGIFSLGCIFFYLGYARQRVRGEGYGPNYWLSLLMFYCSLMAKSVSVVLPLLLLVLDWHPLGRLDRISWGRLVSEKLPFFAGSLAMALLTIHFAGETGYLVSYAQFPFTQRLAVSGNAIFEYLRLFVLPLNISPLHVIPDPIPVAYTVKSILAAVLLAALVFFGREKKWLPVALAGFVIPLVPVLAFFQNGDQAYAARFTYLPSVLPCVVLAAALAAGMEKWGKRGPTLRLTAACLLGVPLLLAGIMTVRLTAVWKDTGTMWSRAVEIEPSATLFKERGRYYHSVGMFDKAVADYTSAINAASGDFKRYVYNLYAFRGGALRAGGRNAEALQDFTTAISLSPHPLYFLLRGETLKAMGRVKEADEDFRIAGAVPSALEWYWEPVH